MKITARELNNGYQYLKNKIQLVKEHGIYHVRGYKTDNTYIWECFANLKDAVNLFRSLD